MVYLRLGRMFLCRRCYSEASTWFSRSRAFSSTPQRRRTIPSFSPCSSPELDDLLMTFRTKIFTPETLSKFHRDLIYKPSHHKTLLGDPGVTVTMSDDEEVKLEPMQIRDRPNKRKSLQQLLDLLKDGRDWNNLPAFLEGMVMAGSKLPKGYIERFVRRANEHGMTGIIIRCAQMVNKTGVTLADPQVTNELMLGIHCNAVKAGFEGEVYGKAVHHAQEVALLMERREHCDASLLRPYQEDMRKNITVLAVLLEMRAAQPTHTDGWTSLASISKLVARILALWPDQDLTTPTNQIQARIQLEKQVPLWSAMNLALKTDEVRTSGLEAGLIEARDALVESIERTRRSVEETAGGRTRRCLYMYEEMKIYQKGEK